MMREKKKRKRKRVRKALINMTNSQGVRRKDA